MHSREIPNISHHFKPLSYLSGGSLRTGGSLCPDHMFLFHSMSFSDTPVLTHQHISCRCKEEKIPQLSPSIAQANFFCLVCGSSNTPFNQIPNVPTTLLSLSTGLPCHISPSYEPKHTSHACFHSNGIHAMFTLSNHHPIPRVKRRKRKATSYPLPQIRSTPPLGHAWHIKGTVGRLNVRVWGGEAIRHP